jgi:hypothetical protein
MLHSHCDTRYMSLFLYALRCCGRVTQHFICTPPGVTAVSIDSEFYAPHPSTSASRRSINIQCVTSHAARLAASRSSNMPRLLGNRNPTLV